jgi:hypothetical protein
MKDDPRFFDLVDNVRSQSGTTVFWSAHAIQNAQVFC